MFAESLCLCGWLRGDCVFTSSIIHGNALHCVLVIWLRVDIALSWKSSQAGQWQRTKCRWKCLYKKKLDVLCKTKMNETHMDTFAGLFWTDFELLNPQSIKWKRTRHRVLTNNTLSPFSFSQNHYIGEKVGAWRNLSAITRISIKLVLMCHRSLHNSIVVNF